MPKRRLIEDIGVNASKYRRPSVDEFVQKRANLAYYEFIAYKMKDINKYITWPITCKRSHFFLTLILLVSMGLDVETDQVIGSEVVFEGTYSKLTRLDVIYQDRVIESLDLHGSERTYSFRISPRERVYEPGLAKYTIVGYRQNEKLVQTYRRIRYVPPDSDRLVIEPYTVYDWDFRLNQFTVVYHVDSLEQAGWRVSDGAAYIGNGVRYENNVYSHLTFFTEFKNDSAPCIFLNATIDTEPKHDFLHLMIKEGDREMREIYTWHGNHRIEEYVNLLEYLDDPDNLGKLDISLAFSSDAAVTAKGVTVHAFSFMA